MHNAKLTPYTENGKLYSPKSISEALTLCSWMLKDFFPHLSGAMADANYVAQQNRIVELESHLPVEDVSNGFSVICTEPVLKAKLNNLAAEGDELAELIRDTVDNGNYLGMEDDINHVLTRTNEVCSFLSSLHYHLKIRRLSVVRYLDPSGTKPAA